MTKTTCPYCGHEQDEPDECYLEDELYETECKNCGKIYGIRPYYVKSYRESKMDCANGGEHKWEEMQGYPGEFFTYKRMCKYCGEVKIIDQKKHEESRKKYFDSLENS